MFWTPIAANRPILLCVNQSHPPKSGVTAPSAEQGLEDNASEIVVEDGIDNGVEETVDVAEPGQQREKDRIDSADGADVEQVVADADCVADVYGKERDPAEQEHALHHIHIAQGNRRYQTSLKSSTALWWASLGIPRRVKSMLFIVE